MTIIMISYIFKTFKLVIIIFQVSYFIGILFYIYCCIVRDLHQEGQGAASEYGTGSLAKHAREAGDGGASVDSKAEFFVSRWLSG